MIIIQGPRAFSDFQLRRRLVPHNRRHAGDLPRAESLTARYVHFLDCAAPPDTAESERIARLLDYGEAPTAVVANAPSLIVVPRIGTISPWSSKATDIFHCCGLTNVRRVERGVIWQASVDLGDDTLAALTPLIHDPMTESVLYDIDAAAALFATTRIEPLTEINVIDEGKSALQSANESLGLALNDEEINYLFAAFEALDRNPTDVELMMFAQANSEHCRHKIFNARWSIDGRERDQSLFGMIRETHAASPSGTLVAYDDNAAVLEGTAATRLIVNPRTHAYEYSDEPVHFLAKVETHNHPTAISPLPGAATGSGGEIRDEGATGRGGKPKAGLTGFSVSNLHLPGAARPWELEFRAPARIASALDIMLEGPIGAASFNNEFGRPGIGGYFRTFEIAAPVGNAHQRIGYHKPIMLAGGLGNVRADHVDKIKFEAGALIVVLGGPGMAIGLGGGAASSVASGSSDEALDFASVQRANPEMQRRCQEVIDACVALGAENPIASIHDVGAGGLSNAIPELVFDAGRGARLELRDSLIADAAMTPLQIWCNESQERYVVAIPARHFPQFERICARERCLFAVMGRATDDTTLVVSDRNFDSVATSAGLSVRAPTPIDVDLALILGKPPRMSRDVKREPNALPPLCYHDINIEDAAERVLTLPVVGDKSFLITIGDRTVTGLINRDPMVGPWQVPVADCAVTLASHTHYSGEAMAIGERAPLAVIDAAASARMALGEAITNIASADVDRLDAIRVSANWMAAAGEAGQDAHLYDAVEALARNMAIELGIAIPVGKDSMSMATRWQEEGEDYRVIAPLSLVITAFAPVDDVRRTVTPLLARDAEVLMAVDLGCGHQRLGGSALAQVYGQIGSQCPDAPAPAVLRGFFDFIRTQSQLGRIRAYHDRSDGGLWTSLCEMVFASRRGVDIQIDALCSGADPIPVLFNEELGAVIQVRRADVAAISDAFDGALQRASIDTAAAPRLVEIGRVIADDAIRIRHGERVLIDAARARLQKIWSETSWRIQRLRDQQQCADDEHARIDDRDDRGLEITAFDFDIADAAPVVSGARPEVAILREQGVNAHHEMAAAFLRAGFSPVDVTLTDIVEGREDLSRFRVLAACGGFSFGDVLGGGQGWAKVILFNDRARDVFGAYFNRADTLSLGVCNGCQMLAGLTELIPGSGHWPRFVGNHSEQFEGRLVAVEITPSSSPLLDGMQGARLPIAVAHGEGKAVFDSAGTASALSAAGGVTMRYIDGNGNPTQRYPFNPNGADNAVAGVCSNDGRVTIVMPHPERMVRSVQYSWHPDHWGDQAPWSTLFANARRFLA